MRCQGARSRDARTVNTMFTPQAVETAAPPRDNRECQQNACHSEASGTGRFGGTVYQSRQAPRQLSSCCRSVDLTARTAQ